LNSRHRKKSRPEPAAAPVCHDELEQISRAATEALTDARTIISAMHAAHVDDNGHATPPVGKRVDINFGELGRTHDERLAKTGIIGTTIIGAVLPRRLPRESGIVVLAALDEIYSNIMKHADHEKGYCVTISSANMQLHITVADTPAVEQADAPLSAGSGIAQCERSVRAIGGTVTLHEGTPWTMGISIPLTRQMSA
jgi:signal transduction histidine kinase